MKRVLGHCLAGAAAIACGAALVLACQHDDESLFVQNVLYPTPVAAGNSCTYTADPHQTFLPRGTLDVGFQTIYSAWYLLGNQLVPRSNGQQLQSETSTINVQGAVVRVTAADGTSLAKFTSLTSGTVYPSTGTVPGYESTQIQILDQATVAGVAGGAALQKRGSFVTVVTYAKFFGHTLGGTYVESNEFEFPVDICFGCLVNFSQGDNPCYSAPNCVGTGTGTGGSASSLPLPCIIGQDTAIQCSQCLESPICNPTPTLMSTCTADAGAG